MAVINSTQAWIARRISKTTWANLANGDTGVSDSSTGLSDKTVQVKGTFGVGANVNIEGSNDGGTTWSILNDSRGEGNPLSITTAIGADIRTILENPQLIRPNVTAGDGTTSLTVIIVAASTA